MIGETLHAADADDASVASQPASAQVVDEAATLEKPPQATVPREIGGRGGLDPTRYGDWEKDGRCIDF